MSARQGGATQHDPMGQGPKRCRTIGITAVRLFAEQLSERAAQAPLTAADIATSLASFLTAGPEATLKLYGQAFNGCGRPQEKPQRQRRAHFLERALVGRFEHLLRIPDADGVMVSRRVVLGLIFALTRMAGPSDYAKAETAARGLASHYPNHSDEVYGDPRMEWLVDVLLARVAGHFDDFMPRFDDFIRSVNLRLRPPQAGAWDAEWELDRPAALKLLDALFGGLRRHLAAGEADAAFGAGSAAGLRHFFEGLDEARRVARRPWVKRRIGTLAG